MQIQIIPRPKPTPSKTTPQAVRLEVSYRPLRVLDFDVECRPLHFYGDYVSKEITAIAWAWCDDPEHVECRLLGEVEGPDMLRDFVAAYDLADLVTGHFIRGFDLPLIQGQLTEYGMPALGDKRTCDTKLDLLRRHGFSGSQENLGSMLELDNPKVGMNQGMWRKANRLTPEGLALVKERVVGDVKQHIEMRRRLLELGYLSAPKWWRSGSAHAEEYTP